MFSSSKRLDTKKSLRDTIYHLTKDRNHTELSKLVDAGLCLGIIENHYNAIMLLAMENDIASVEYLIENFDGNINNAVFGYALGGFKNQVQDLLNRNASKNHAVRGFAIKQDVEAVEDLLDDGANINDAVWGYEFGKHVHQANNLIIRGASVKYAIYGAALAGNEEEVKKRYQTGLNIYFAMHGFAQSKLISEITSFENFVECDMMNPVNHAKSLNGQVKGFAQAAMHSEVEELLNKGADINDAVIGYSLAGDAVKVDELIARKASKHMAVKGFAREGHVNGVNRLVNRGADRSYAIHGYSFGGLDKSDSLKDERNLTLTSLITNSIEGCATSGNISGVEYWLSRGDAVSLRGEKCQKNYFNWAIDGFNQADYFENEPSIIRLLAHLKNNEVRKMLVENKLFNNKMTPLKYNMLEQANKLSRMMSDYNLPYSKAQSLQQKGCSLWLLQGPQLARENIFPADLFIQISCFVLGFSEKNTTAIFHAVNKRLFTLMNDELSKRNFFTEQEREFASKQAEERYQNRIRLS